MMEDFGGATVLKYEWWIVVISHGGEDVFR